MIVRTYGRRKGTLSGTYSGSSSLNDDVSEPFRDSLSQEIDDPLCGFAFSSQDSSSQHWSFFDSEIGDFGNGTGAGGARESKRAKRAPAEGIPATSTLMEAQEFGEMMEHVDEVNFALDGLRKGQPLRIRRASLVSLLTICATTHQRRLLRTQGMAKTIIDAVLGLTLDDSPSNLAAATLFYVLTSDGQDDHLLESPGSVQFLMKLLKPIVSTAIKDKAPKFGYKLLSLRQNDDILKNTTMTGRLDSSSVEVFSRVQEILVNCKELKTCQNDSWGERPELCPKWLALLTMEKACLSAISLDETSGAVRKAGGNFKEKLREHGGLDAVFEVTMTCHSDLENWMKDSSLSIKDSRNDKRIKSLTLLLKCLKIMENATFLSNENQTHLLGMKRKLSPQGPPTSFTELIITVIKILSDLCLRRSASAASNDNKTYDPFSMTSHDSELDQLRDYKENETLSISSTRKYHSVERASSVKSSNASQISRILTCNWLESSLSIAETPSTSTTDSYSLKMRVNSSTSGSCSGASKSSYCKTSRIQNSSGKNVRFMEDTPVVILDDSQDPFAFDEDDFAPSKWDLLSGKPKKSHSKKHVVANREFENECQSHTNVSQQELSNGDINCSSSDVGDEKDSSLLAVCLLAAVKVLMNLTNDNPVGCRQIANYGGLETMSMLIAGHFPSFSSSSSSFAQIKENGEGTTKDNQSDRHLTDHELDFLVAILGLLVNLVEKDGHNRSRLAAASVHLPSSVSLHQEVRKDVIQLLCSIFLANLGESEGAGEDKQLQLNDEAAVLQGEKEAEKMIVEAYSALLLAFLSTESKSIRAAIADNLPDQNLASLVPVLDRFVVCSC
ncbi:Wings apart-like protein-like isoform B [Glycine soja]|uniref:Wings apart-like protein-like isoform B n=1 Tax=Glycine soja TaxID=3848 RepID=A0A445I6J4_GLYSO|nr:Wings apart-like protein-like isoform B [Glycine soja]